MIKFLITLIILISFNANADGLLNALGIGGQPSILEVEKAFIPSLETQAANKVTLHWKVAEGYYLYKDKLNISFDPDIEIFRIDWPKGKIKQDEFFGEIEVFPKDFSIVVWLERENVAEQHVNAIIDYQGCAEVGVCYPPEKAERSITLATASVDNIIEPTAFVEAAPTNPIKITNPVILSEQDKLANTLQDKNMFWSLLIFFGLGLLLAFTPCVFPMVPILSSIIVGQGENISTGKAFGLSSAYVLGMAITNTLLGILVALAGAQWNLQAAFQVPWVLILFSLVFVLLALSMFGFYDLQIPSSWQTKLDNATRKQKSGNYIGVAVMGMLSALIVGPCVAAPLAGILIYIGNTGDVILGGAALFSLSLGMGAPLLLIGTSAGKWLPKAGAWMEAVKAFFGVLLIGVALWLLERILPTQISMLLWSGFFVISAIYMGALENTQTGWARFRKGVGVLLLAYGMLLLIGVSSGSRDIWQPLRGLMAQEQHQELSFVAIDNIENLQQALAQAQQENRPVMLDFYADWCTSCKEMEAYTFTDVNVQTALDNYLLLQADVTKYNQEDKDLLKHFGISGPPTIIFYDEKGNEIKHRRVVGFMQAPTFSNHIKNLSNI